MDNVLIWIIIVVISIVLGSVQQMSLDKTMDGKKKGFCFQLFELWRHFISFIFTGVIGYFFLEFRWSQIISAKGVLSTSDVFLGIVFLMGILGWIPYFIKNITMGINAIISRFFK